MGKSGGLWLLPQRGCQNSALLRPKSGGFGIFQSFQSPKNKTNFSFFHLEVSLGSLGESGPRDEILASNSTGMRSESKSTPGRLSRGCRSGNDLSRQDPPSEVDPEPLSLLPPLQDPAGIPPPQPGEVPCRCPSPCLTIVHHSGHRAGHAAHSGELFPRFLRDSQGIPQGSAGESGQERGSQRSSGHRKSHAGINRRGVLGEDKNLGWPKGSARWPGRAAPHGQGLGTVPLTWDSGGCPCRVGDPAGDQGAPSGAGGGPVATV